MSINRNTRWVKTVGELTLLIVPCILARAAFISVLPESAVSGDLNAFINICKLLTDGKNPYLASDTLNYWPPFWVYFLAGIAQINHWTGPSLLRLIQYVLIGSEVVLLITLYVMCRRERKSGYLLPLLFGLSLNPCCVFLSCQHGNFDVIVEIFMVLFLAAMCEYARSEDPVVWLAACLLLGIGIQAKTIPIVLTPLLFVRGKKLGVGRRIFGAILVLGPATLAILTVCLTSSATYATKILHYRSTPGVYGVTAVLGIFGVAPNSYIAAFQFIFLVFCLTLTSCIAWRGKLSSEHLIETAVLIFCVVLSLSPGYADQYLYWIVGLLILLYVFGTPLERMAVFCFYLVAAATCFIQYGFVPSHGALFYMMYRTPALLRMSIELGDVEPLIRFPLFVGFLWLAWLMTTKLLVWQQWIAPKKMLERISGLGKRGDPSYAVAPRKRLEVILVASGILIQLAALSGESLMNVPFILRLISPSYFHASRGIEALERNATLSVSNKTDNGFVEISQILGRRTERTLNCGGGCDVRVTKVNVEELKVFNQKQATAIHWEFNCKPVLYQGQVYTNGTDQCSFDDIKIEVSGLKGLNIWFFCFGIFAVGTLIEAVALQRLKNEPMEIQ